MGNYSHSIKYISEKVKFGFVIVPDMLKNAPCFKRMAALAKGGKSAQSLQKGHLVNQRK